MLSAPHLYAVRPEFKIILGVYAATYASKNCTESFCQSRKMSNESEAFWKFWLVLGINGGLCIFWRDPQFAKIFGSKVPTAIPKVSYSLWAARDVVHTFGSVILPDYCEKRYNLTKDQWRMCQVTFPLIVQIITTPIHLLGLDYYNIKDASFGERSGRILKQWAPACGIRMLRMFPPWSIGLLVNRSIRDSITNSFKDK